MSDSKLIATAAPLAGLKATGRSMFGRYRGHPVSVRQQSSMDGNGLVFQVLLASEAMPAVSAAVQDKESLKAFGLKPAAVHVIPRERTLAYSFRPAVRSPKPEEVKAMLDGLVALADRGGPPLGERCEQCGAMADRIRLVNGSPVQLCDADFQKLSMRYGTVSSAVRAAKTKWANGLALGLLGLVVGSLLWAGILIASGRIFSLAAIVIAVLIGGLVMKGAGKPNYALVGVMAVLTILAIFAGTILWIAVEIVRIGGPFSLVLAFEGFQVVVAEDSGALGSTIFFGLLGVFIGGSYMLRTTRAATPRFEVVE